VPAPSPRLVVVVQVVVRVCHAQDSTY